MNPVRSLCASAASSLLLGAIVCSSAWAAPGEDTIVLLGPVKYTAMPGPPPARSSGLDGGGGIPAWMQARMSRYTAKAFSATADDGTIFTDSDVVTSVEADGLRKTCVQEVASNTGSGELGTRYGPNKQEQIVVLRGDLVNVCR